MRARKYINIYVYYFLIYSFLFRYRIEANLVGGAELNLKRNWLFGNINKEIKKPE